MSTGLFCQKCGELNDSQAQFCRKCGAPQAAVSPATPVVSGTGGAAAPAPAYSSMGSQSVSPVPPLRAAGVPGIAPPPNVAASFRGYGGFWLRLVAVIIDGIVLSIVIVPIWVVLFGAMGVMGRAASSRNPDAVVAAVMTAMPLAMLAIFAINWLYEALLTSSSKQGTLGKMALGLKVVDKAGNRLSFLHATGRYFAKLINGFTFYIGFIIAGFTERKQALHDFIAATYVIKG